ncbi:hypothetical protein H0H87_011985 [Tephrocybe sp. NHM501043]|nr:hypothetical protein H0H87_011985 [Tephrocybe sp. NHM501043]
MSTSSSSISTTKHVEKLTPTAAIVSLEDSVSALSAIIKETSQHLKSAEEKAAERRESIPELVLQRGEEDGLDTIQQARLIAYLSMHPGTADYYFGMKEPNPLRRAVCLEWLSAPVAFTTIIKETSQHLKSAEEKAVERRESMADLVLQRGEEDEFNTTQQATLITYLSMHPGAADYYFGMKEPNPLRRAVCLEWISALL